MVIVYQQCVYLVREIQYMCTHIMNIFNYSKQSELNVIPCRERPELFVISSGMYVCVCACACMYNGGKYIVLKYFVAKIYRSDCLLNLFFTFNTNIQTNECIVESNLYKYIFLLSFFFSCSPMKLIQFFFFFIRLFHEHL